MSEDPPDAFGPGLTAFGVGTIHLFDALPVHIGLTLPVEFSREVLTTAFEEEIFSEALAPLEEVLNLVFEARALRPADGEDPQG
ncbi:hypothetical protein AB9K35_04305 [Leisingera sp. XS_AS12]|uniref:hypothetical protein n=1 Tax=Leisingera sp. XS_AS12 TaxID=3241294 RepID=UPI0035167E57